ncbi:MAG: hypothetical protein A4S09_15975 [Proteobacteria bacterium SG_bin7]|nr:MAG: hypothetical protein A4S09_15975 [Proteobacteria bacterium SG_bin7]
MKNSIFILSLMVVFSGLSEAAIKKGSPLKFNKLDVFAGTGIFQGGESGRAYSLLDIKRTQPKNNSPDHEHFSIFYGDEIGRKILGKTGYFHIILEKNPDRLVIDLSQVQKTAVDEKQLAAIFRNSELVSKTEMTMDPEDLSTNITLYLKQPVKARVKSNTDGKKPGQLVIDMVKTNPKVKPAINKEAK